MGADPLCFDTSYLARLYLRDHGFSFVRELAGAAPAIVCAWHGRAETVAALHRAFRERRLEYDSYQVAFDQFLRDSTDGVFRWLPLTNAVQQRVEQFYRKASPSVFLRAADALHLACAAEHGFTEIYSNDQRFLAAAPHFGLRGIDVIS